ncbi:polyribonucleotide nucleotidyltransferase [Candidatus Sumerlaeota bacterium]
MSEKFTVDFGRGELSFEIGRVARQAHGAVWARWGDTIVLAACVTGPNYRNTDFFPLMVDYRDKMYGDGRIPGNFFRREGRPSDHETLKARMIDRPLRPLFPDGFMDEVQVYLNSYSVDQENEDVLVAMNAASCALLISSMPFTTPVGCVRVGMVEGELAINPTIDQMKESELDLLVAGTAEAISMVECGAKVVSEDVLVEGLGLAHEHIKRVCAFQEEVRAKVGREKVAFEAPEPDEAVVKATRKLAEKELAPVYDLTEKCERSDAKRAAVTAVCEAMAEQLDEETYAANVGLIRSTTSEMLTAEVRRRAVAGTRPDGRGMTDIRPIDVEVSVLPKAHGSSIFTRGQTQSLGTCTLGTKENAALIDDIRGLYDKYYYLHYNFPAWCVGEVKPPRGPGRREIGHGMLAEKSIQPVLPSRDDFPYTIRLVSETLESNGSSSMASVCSCCLALMDCGVPIAAPVAGIAMGLIKEGDEFGVLSDITGEEDHLGDMDFKVAGTSEGVTSLQMDIKVTGVTLEIMGQALAQAKEGRVHILGKMAEVLAAPRPELSAEAPRLTTLKINPAKIGALIGPGGKNIRAITEETGVKIDVEEDGTVFIATNDAEACDKAMKLVEALTDEAEMGKIYTAKIARMADFGCFVSILPNQDGMVHISEMTVDRLSGVDDLCREGDTMTVKVIDIDSDSGKVRLSRKAALEELGSLPDEDLNPDPSAKAKREQRDARRNGMRGRGGGGRRR